jgi:hypothetical protein
MEAGPRNLGGCETQGARPDEPLLARPAWAEEEAGNVIIAFIGIHGGLLNVPSSDRADGASSAKCAWDRAAPKRSYSSCLRKPGLRSAFRGNFCTS